MMLVLLTTGVSITRSSNRITDLISGYTMTLKETTSSQATFSSSFNTDTALLAMSLFVDQLNAINTSLDTLTRRGCWCGCWAISRGFRYGA